MSRRRSRKYIAEIRRWQKMVGFNFIIVLSSVILLLGYGVLVHGADAEAEDAAALLDVMAHISADPTAFFASWTNSTPHCTWPGVVCDTKSRRVVALLLDSLRLHGTLSPKLSTPAYLPALTYLNVSNNLLHGALPAFARPSLTHLDVSANHFFGGFPPSLANCTSLTYIDFNHNLLTSSVFPDFFANISSLTYLDLSANAISGTLPRVFHTPKLQFFQIYSANIAGEIPPSLINSTSLRWLDLGDNVLTGHLPSDWTPLAPSLQQLKLYGNLLSGAIPASLSNCTLLAVLGLENNNITGEIPSSFGQLRQLQDVRLFYNSLSGRIPASIMNCTQLINLQLAYNRLSGALPYEVGQLGQVQWLTLTGNTDLSGAIPDSIGACMELQQLTFEYTSVGGVLPPSLFNLSSLQVLKLTGSDFAGPLPEDVRRLTSLQNLRLGDNSFDGPIPAGLGHLKSLEGLYLQGNRFTGTIPAGLSGCTSISEMNFSRNSLSGNIPATFSQLQSLNKLSIDHNQLSGSIPDIFSKLTRLQVLNLGHNQFCGAIPPSLANLATISELLDLSFNKLSGPIPASIGGMQMLIGLNLSHNHFTGPIPVSLGQCRGLQSLDLSNNLLEGSIPSELGQISSLQSLDLSYNNLSGSLPSSLGSQLMGLFYFNVSYNNLQGAIPDVGVYRNFSIDSYLGNLKLCGDPLPLSCLFSSGNPHSSTIGSSKSTGYTIIAVSIVICVLIFALAAITAGFLWRYRYRYSRSTTIRSFQMRLFSSKSKFLNDKLEEEGAGKDIEAASWVNIGKQQNFKAWTAQEIRALTDSFNSANIIGSGGVSVCYIGTLECSKGKLPVAIKRLKMGGRREKEARRSFVTELKTICKMRHRNLVKVLGYCVEGGEVALVMEYMGRGDLDDHLHPGTESSSDQSLNSGLSTDQSLNEYKTTASSSTNTRTLSWEQRMKVALDVAEGLVYLHHEYVQPTIHCDLKPKNVLLGFDMVAKISDFGIAKLVDDSDLGADMSTSKFRGTFGYAAPEYAGGGRISTQADVYSYGVMLLELITGVSPTSPKLQEGNNIFGCTTLHTWVRTTLMSSGSSNVQDAETAARTSNPKVMDVLDTSLRVAAQEDAAILHEAEVVLTLALCCSSEVPKDRPTMKNVRDSLVRLFSSKRMGGSTPAPPASPQYPDIDELLQAPDVTFSLPAATQLLMDPTADVECSGLQFSSNLYKN